MAHLCLFRLSYCGLKLRKRPPRQIASVGYAEAGESLIRRIAQRRLLVGLHNKYLNQLLVLKGDFRWYDATERVPLSMPHACASHSSQAF
jgi:hypothetical protein